MKYKEIPVGETYKIVNKNPNYKKGTVLISTNVYDNLNLYEAYIDEDEDSIIGIIDGDMFINQCPYIYVSTQRIYDSIDYLPSNYIVGTRMRKVFRGQPDYMCYDFICYENGKVLTKKTIEIPFKGITIRVLHPLFSWSKYLIIAIDTQEDVIIYRYDINTHKFKDMSLKGNSYGAVVYIDNDNVYVSTRKDIKTGIIYDMTTGKVIFEFPKELVIDIYEKQLYVINKPFIYIYNEKGRKVPYYQLVIGEDKYVGQMNKDKHIIKMLKDIIDLNGFICDGE